MEASRLGALAPCGVNDLCERNAALGDDRPKDFEDFGSLVDESVGSRRRDELVDLFAQLAMKSCPACGRRQFSLAFLTTRMRHEQ
ncbi:hypothetical protein ACOJVU_11145 [Mycobacterium sp. THU-M104]|uniref:hypothetical protein n=1 Tax=Mycobacterium sp. THU-M104 TaxID=3410515 RepID=UPI003B9A4BB4